MGAKLASALPKGSGNGLSQIAEELVEHPEKVHVLVLLVDCSKVTSEIDSGDVVPTARIRRIEAITDPIDGDRLRQVLRRAWERRTGKDVLPIDLEDDINAAFGVETGKPYREDNET
jgi:hypothetical protein